MRRARTSGPSRSVAAWPVVGPHGHDRAARRAQAGCALGRCPVADAKGPGRATWTRRKTPCRRSGAAARSPPACSCLTVVVAVVTTTTHQLAPRLGTQRRSPRLPRSTPIVGHRTIEHPVATATARSARGRCRCRPASGPRPAPAAPGDGGTAGARRDVVGVGGRRCLSSTATRSTSPTAAGCGSRSPTRPRSTARAEPCRTRGVRVHRAARAQPARHPAALDGAPTTDGFGRTLAEVVTADDTSLNVALVAAGLGIGRRALHRRGPRPRRPAAGGSERLRPPPRRGLGATVQHRRAHVRRTGSPGESAPSAPRVQPAGRPRSAAGARRLPPGLRRVPARRGGPELRRHQPPGPADRRRRPLPPRRLDHDPYREDGIGCQSS